MGDLRGTLSRSSSAKTPSARILGARGSLGETRRDRAMPVRVRKTGRSHEIMIPRSAGEGRKVNSRTADEVPAEHGPAMVERVW